MWSVGCGVVRLTMLRADRIQSVSECWGSCLGVAGAAGIGGGACQGIERGTLLLVELLDVEVEPPRSRMCWGIMDSSKGLGTSWPAASQPVTDLRCDWSQSRGLSER